MVITTKKRLLETKKNLPANLSQGIQKKKCSKYCSRHRRKSRTLNVEYINEKVVLHDIVMHWLLSISWPTLIALSAGATFCFIVIFSPILYWLDERESWQEAFALSAQTFLTIGYGGIAPLTLWGHTLVYLETFMSVIVLTIVTGIPYIKFSKPQSKLVFAMPIINRGEKGPQLQCRLAMNTQNAHMVNVKFKLTLARTERKSNGSTFTFFDELDLKTTNAAHVALNFTITHFMRPETSFLYQYIRQALHSYAVKPPHERDEGGPLAGKSFVLILNVSGTDIIYQDVIYATKVFRSEDLRYNCCYDDMINETGDEIMHLGESNKQLIMMTDDVDKTKKTKYRLEDEVVLALEDAQEQKKKSEHRPMIDAPFRDIETLDKGGKISCCIGKLRPASQQAQHPNQFLIRSRKKACPRFCFWHSLQMNFLLVILLSLAVWTFVNFSLAVLFVLPFTNEKDNSTEHLSYDSFTGEDHNRNMTLAAAFFFSVQTLSSVGYGYLTPTSLYGDFSVAFFGSIAVVLISIFGGIVFSRTVAIQPLFKFSKLAVITNNTLDGRCYLQFKIVGLWCKQPTVNVFLKALVLVKTRDELGALTFSWRNLKLRCSNFPTFDIPVTALHEIDDVSPFNDFVRIHMRKRRDRLKQLLRRATLKLRSSQRFLTAQQKYDTDSNDVQQNGTTTSWGSSNDDDPSMDISDDTGVDDIKLKPREEVLRVVASVTGYDTTYGRHVHAVHVYLPHMMHYGMHFKEQIYYSASLHTNFVDMSVFDEIQMDILWYKRTLLSRSFIALKKNWQSRFSIKTPKRQRKFDSGMSSIRKMTTHSNVHVVLKRVHPEQKESVSEIIHEEV